MDQKPSGGGGARADGVLVLGLALVLGGLALVAPAEVLAVTVLALLLFPFGKARRKIVLVALFGLTVGWFRATHAERRFERERAAVSRPSIRCEGAAEVISSPVRARGAFRFLATFEPSSCEGTTEHIAPAPTMLYADEGDLLRGDQLRVVAQLAPPEEIWNVETGDPRPGEARRDVLRSGGVVALTVVRHGHGPLAWIDRARAHTRHRIDLTFDADIAPMARALVLGESDLNDEDDQAFRASGLAHLLAVSGAHLVIVVAGFVAFVRALLAQVSALTARVDVARVAAVPGIVGSWIYADFAGGSGSAWRAAWMLSFALTARALGRKADGPRAFALSLVAMVLVDPLVGFDVSFGLSAAATAGLFLYSRPAADAIRRVVPFVGPKLATAVSASFGASLACAPLLARIAPSLPAGGLVANLFAVPVGELAALPLCLLHGILSPFPASERGCAVLASGGLRIVLALARTFSASAVRVPMLTSWQLASFAVGLVAFPVLRGGRRAAVALGCLAFFCGAELGAIHFGKPHGALRATFLDVGQGDSALVDLPDGSSMLIDGGGMVGSPVDVGARVVSPILRARRRSAVDVVILSHPHPDHFGGLFTGLDGVRVGEAWDTGQGERESVGGGYARFFDRLRSEGRPIRSPAEICGDHAIGGAKVTVLAPCPSYDPDEPPNDNSLVVKIAYGHRSFLFVGDAEHFEEAALLAHGGLRADVLKVGHHGSRTSSSAAFIAAVAPSEAVISVGSRNRFGHPNPLTLETLAAAHVRAWRTDLEGEIRIETDGENLEVFPAHAPSGG